MTSDQNDQQSTKSDDSKTDFCRKRKNSIQSDCRSKLSRIEDECSNASVASMNEKCYGITLSNFPTSWGYTEIFKFLGVQKFGEIVFKTVNREEKTAWITYETEADTDEALTKLAGLTADGNVLTLTKTIKCSDYQTPWEERDNKFSHNGDVWGDNEAGLYGFKREFLSSLGIEPPINSCLHITNFRCDKSELREVLELAGHIENLVVTMGPKRYARVKYSHPVEAVQAVSMLNNQVLYGKALQVVMPKVATSSFVLPRGLNAVGPGLGINGKPLKNIVQQYEKFIHGKDSDVNTDVFDHNKVSYNAEWTLLPDDTNVIKQMKGSGVTPQDIVEAISLVKSQIDTKDFHVQNIDSIPNPIKDNTNNKGTEQKSTVSPVNPQIVQQKPIPSPVVKTTPNIGIANPGRIIEIAKTQQNQFKPMNQMRTGPINNRPMGQGPGGPVNQGPMNQGPMNQGPMNQGPMNQGPMNQGLMNQGRMNQSNMNQNFMGPAGQTNQMNQGFMGQGGMNQMRPMGQGFMNQGMGSGFRQGPNQMRPMGQGQMGQNQMGFGGQMGQGNFMRQVMQMNQGQYRPMMGQNMQDSNQSRILVPINLGGQHVKDDLKNSTTIELMNLPPTMTFPVLYNKLSRIGQVTALNFTAAGCAQVKFINRMHAEKCLQVCNNTYCEGNLILVKFV